MMPNLMFTIHFKFGFHDGCRVMLYCVWCIKNKNVDIKVSAHDAILQ